MARTAHAVVLEREASATSLHSAEHSYEEIAYGLGYANRGSAWKAVDRGLRAERDGRAGEYLLGVVGREER